jgi:hypothetical protein
VINESIQLFNQYGESTKCKFLLFFKLDFFFRIVSKPYRQILKSHLATTVKWEYMELKVKGNSEKTLLLRADL